MDFRGAFIESLFVTTGFAALGGILFWLIAGKYWGKVKAKPYQLGLWWAAWLAAASVMAAGGKYYRLGFEEVFFRIILTVPILFAVGFLAGFGFRKLKAIASTLPVVAHTPSYTSGASDSHFAEAMAEIEKSRMDKGLWARCFAECDGDHEKAKASYIRERVAVLAAAVTPSVSVGEMAANDVKPSASVNFATPIIGILVILAVALVTGLSVKDKDSQVSTIPVAPVEISSPSSPPVVGTECSVYWDGFRYQLGSRKTKEYPNYTEFSRTKNGVFTLYFSLPRELLARLGYDGNNELLESSSKFKEFWDYNLPRAAQLCGF